MAQLHPEVEALFFTRGEGTHDENICMGEDLLYMAWKFLQALVKNYIIPTVASDCSPDPRDLHSLWHKELELEWAVTTPAGGRSMLSKPSRHDPN